MIKNNRLFEERLSQMELSSDPAVRELAKGLKSAQSDKEMIEVIASMPGERGGVLLAVIGGGVVDNYPRFEQIEPFANELGVNTDMVPLCDIQMRITTLSIMGALLKK